MLFRRQQHADNSRRFQTHGKEINSLMGNNYCRRRIVVPKSLCYAAQNALNFGHPGINKMCPVESGKKPKTCSACLKTQLPNTEKSKIEWQEIPGKEIQIDLTENLNSKQ